MSLNIRYLTNGEKEVFTITNTGVTPNEFCVVNSREEIDESIRHYAPEKPQFCSVDIARMFGVLDIFYPDNPKCTMDGHIGKPCIADACKYWGIGKCIVYPVK